MSLEGKGRNFGKLYHFIIDSGALAAMKPTDLKLYSVLLRYADFRTGNARPTDQTIAGKAGVNRSSIPPARARLQGMGLIKAWRHQGRWHYNLRGDIFQNFTGVYPAKETQADNVRKITRPYRKCTECGRFAGAENIGHKCRKNLGGVLREKSGAGLEIVRDKLETPAGEGSALSGAKASPASEAVKDTTWIVYGKVEYWAFHCKKFRLDALEKPSQKFIAWLRECGCTEDEINGLIAKEYRPSGDACA